jgi:hypothetical protein
MYGFTATLTGIRFDQALTSTIKAFKVERFGVPNNLDVQRAVKCKLCAARLLRRAYMQFGDNGAPVRAA